MKRPTIIVCGPDGVGKTPIAHAMAHQLGVPYFKVSIEKAIFRREQGPETLWFDLLLTQFLEQADCGMVSDRGYPCEWVYSQVFKRETDHSRLREIDECHAALGTKVVVLYSSETPTKVDELVPRELYGDILDRYREFMRWTRCDVMRYDTSKSLAAIEQLEGDLASAVGQGPFSVEEASRIRANWDAEEIIQTMFPSDEEFVVTQL